MNYKELVKRLRNRRICIQQSGNLNDYPLLREAADAIEDLTAKKVVRGEWQPDVEDVKWGSSLIKMRCSHCKNYAHFDKEKYCFILSNFCPSCGAEMMNGKKVNDA